MKPRATAVVLAMVLVVLGATVSAGAGACCPPDGRTAPTVRAIDCCAAVIACAPRTPEAVATATRADLTRMEPLAVVLAPMSHLFLNPIAAAASLSTPRETPPLQRLHAPLRL